MNSVYKMNSGKNILWLIAARSGSKSIPHKNIKILGDLPLIAYRIKSALRIASPENVWVSTDSIEYADIARECEATIPYLRPPELATDEAKSTDVVLHAMDWAEKNNMKYDALGLLEPTSPFVLPGSLLTAVEKLFMDKNAENAVAVRKVCPSTFYVEPEKKYLTDISSRIRNAGILRRQDEMREITPSGGFYIAKWSAFLANETFYTDKTIPCLVPDLEGLEIDEKIDWDWAEFLIKTKRIDLEQLL